MLSLKASNSFRRSGKGKFSKEDVDFLEESGLYCRRFNATKAEIHRASANPRILATSQFLIISLPH